MLLELKEINLAISFFCEIIIDNDQLYVYTLLYKLYLPFINL